MRKLVKANTNRKDSIEAYACACNCSCPCAGRTNQVTEAVSKSSAKAQSPNTK